MYPVQFDLASWKIAEGALKGKSLKETVPGISFACQIVKGKGPFEVPGDGVGFALHAGTVKGGEEPAILKKGEALTLSGKIVLDSEVVLFVVYSTEPPHGKPLAVAKVVPHHLQSDFHHQWVLLLRLKEFVVDRMNVFDRLAIGVIPKTYQIFFCVEEGATLSVDGHTAKLEMNAAYCIPAESHQIVIEGRCQVLRIRLD